MDAGRETKHLPNITPEFVAGTPGLVYSQVLLLTTFEFIVSFSLRIHSV